MSRGGAEVGLFLEGRRDHSDQGHIEEVRGWRRLHSVQMRKSRTPFPVTAMKNMKQKGSEIQMWIAVSPGMSAKKKVCEKR